MNSARPIRSVGVAIAIAASPLALAGCDIAASPYADLNRAAQPSDQLPDPAAADAAINPESARLVALATLKWPATSRATRSVWGKAAPSRICSCLAGVKRPTKTMSDYRRTSTSSRSSGARH